MLSNKKRMLLDLLQTKESFNVLAQLILVHTKREEGCADYDNEVQKLNKRYAEFEEMVKRATERV